MARMKIRGAEINYEVLGSDGPWFVLTPGGRSRLEASRTLGERIASTGYRVLLHDRRNCGASDVAIAPEGSEDEMFADDVFELLASLDGLPAFVGGTAAGNRVCFNLALRHPRAVRALVLMWPSGGSRAAEILARDYYGQYAEVARDGGMAAVCETPYYRERIELNPRNRDLLLGMSVGEFVATMERWSRGFLASADLPTIGVSEQSLRSITAPALVFPGLEDDPIHGREAGETVGRLIQNAEVHHLTEIRRPGGEGNGGWLRSALAQRAADPMLIEVMLDFARRVTEAEAAEASPASS